MLRCGDKAFFTYVPAYVNAAVTKSTSKGKHTLKMV